MEDTQDLSTCVTKVQENVLQWEGRLQSEHGGPSRLPVDERCGMVKRFMVPELERMTAFLGARLVPAEVEDILGQVLLEPPPKRGTSSGASHGHRAHRLEGGRV